MTKKEVWDFIKDNWETISAIAAVSVPVIALFPGYIRALTKSKIELLLAGEDEIQKNGIDYIRVLGYTNKGREYLNTIKKNIKVYTNIKNGINLALDIELKASKILDIIYNLNLLNKEQSGPTKS